MRVFTRDFKRYSITLVNIRRDKRSVLLAACSLHDDFMNVNVGLFHGFVTTVVMRVDKVRVGCRLAMFSNVQFRASNKSRTILFRLLGRFCVVIHKYFRVSIREDTFQRSILVTMTILFALVIFLCLHRVDQYFRILVSNCNAICSVVSYR